VECYHPHVKDRTGNEKQETLKSINLRGIQRRKPYESLIDNLRLYKKASRLGSPQNTIFLLPERSLLAHLLLDFWRSPFVVANIKSAHTVEDCGAIHPLPQYAFMAWCLVKAQGQLYFTTGH